MFEFVLKSSSSLSFSFQRSNGLLFTGTTSPHAVATLSGSLLPANAATRPRSASSFHRKSPSTPTNVGSFPLLRTPAAANVPTTEFGCTQYWVVAGGESMATTTIGWVFGGQCCGCGAIATKCCTNTPSGSFDPV